MWEWFGVSYVSFWQPILSPSQKPWRDEHVRAHVYWGVLASILLHFIVVQVTLNGHLLLLDFHSSAVLRVTAVTVLQFTVWEYIQRENWRPELQGLKTGHGYPWLSAIWDTLFAFLGSLSIELVLFTLALAI